MEIVKSNKVGNGAMRVTIPYSAREELNLKIGDEFRVTTDEKSIIFTKVKA